MKPRVLFLCTGNSARSQMAEGWLRHPAGDRYDVGSAGTQPVGLNPGSVEAMAEVGIDIAHHRSKHVAEYATQPIGYVITGAIAPKKVALVGQEPFDSSIGVSTIRQPSQSLSNNGDKYSGESATRLLPPFASSWPQFRHDPPCSDTPVIRERQIRVDLIVTVLPATVSILLENSGEDQVGNTSEESRRWQRHHPSQDHATNRRPAYGVQAFEKADSDNGRAADVGRRDG